MSRFSAIRSSDNTGHNNRTETRLRRQELEDVCVAFADGCSLEENTARIVVRGVFRRQSTCLRPDFIASFQPVIVVGRMVNDPGVNGSDLGFLIHSGLDDLCDHLVGLAIDLARIILGCKMLIGCAFGSQSDMQDLVFRSVLIADDEGNQTVLIFCLDHCCFNS